MLKRCLNAAGSLVLAAGAAGVLDGPQPASANPNRPTLAPADSRSASRRLTHSVTWSPSLGSLLLCTHYERTPLAADSWSDQRARAGVAGHGPGGDRPPQSRVRRADPGRPFWSARGLRHPR